jgi:hypothetical protein
VIIIVIACILVYLAMLFFLQRDSSIAEFLAKDFADSSNSFLTWGTTSVIYCTLVSVLFSQFIPFIPPKIADLQLFGYELNKFGFTFLGVSAFYLLKALLGYIYYASVGNIRKWNIFYFTATKFYFCVSLLLIFLCLGHYYFMASPMELLNNYVLLFIIILIFKLIYYFFHKNRILPYQWYYKILYICTLQILPVLVLWKLLFL